ncbi:unnamed protein product [Phytomonas sp. EM1]|nr:unnamed protein product [Phytomonas sp. EM1]|eukprot:CCW60781.1 unnamed protein product [Phytomonas sp. isolate EM1]
MKRFSNSASKDNLITLKKKRKPLAELVHEELDASTSHHSPSDRYGKGDPLTGDDADAGMGGAVEEYDWENDSEEAFSPSSSAKNGKTRKRLRGEEDSRGKLRRRGPLDPMLSQGKYAATPVDVETAMDNIFGALDMADLDAEGEELYEVDEDGEEGLESDDDDGAGEESDDDFETRGKKKGKKAARKKVKRAKDLTEEEYVEWLSKKQQKRRRTAGGLLSSSDPHGGEEEAILEQLESLRQQQLQLVRRAPREGEGEGEVESSSASPSRAQEAIRHFVSLYTQLLHVRAKLQPAVCRAVGLPPYYARSLFLEGLEDGGRAGKPASAAAENDPDVSPEKIQQAYADVRAELRSILAIFFQIGVEASARGTKPPASRRSDPPAVPSFAQLQRRHREIIQKASDCVAFWGDKFVQANSAKLKVIAQPLKKQIEAILASKGRLRIRVQKNAAHQVILGHPLHSRARLEVSTAADPSEADRVLQAKTQRAMAIAAGDLDEELYDDSDFVRELVRRGGFAAQQLKQQLLDLATPPQLGKEPAKKGFHRLTKGKSVSYEPRPKIVGFQMARGFEGSGRNDVIMKSLFQ